MSTGVSPNDDEPADAPDAPPFGGICDGSDEIRLVVASHLGPGTLPAYSWRTRGARPFLVVDGKCHYYAAGYELGPMTQGQLTAETLAELTSDLLLEDLAGLPSRRDDCSFHWSDRLITTKDQSLRCRCDDCGEGTPSTAVIEKGVAWIDRLIAEGKPLNGVLLATARPNEPPPAAEHLPMQTVYEWPLRAAIPKIQNLYLEEYDPSVFGAYFSGEDAAALRRLRTRAAAKPLRDKEPYIRPFVAYVSDCGRTWELNLRDELPGKLEAKLTAFLEAGWKRPVIPSCIDENNGFEEVSPCPLP